MPEKVSTQKSCPLYFSILFLVVLCQLVMTFIVCKRGLSQAPCELINSIEQVQSFHAL